METDASEDQLRLDDQLCFALYAATNAVVRAYRPLLAKLGLTYPQYLVLMALWQHGRQPVSSLARRLDLPVHAVLPILTRLEHAALLTRERSSSDRRVVEVELTEAGAQLEDQAHQAQRAVVCQTGLSPDALSLLRDELHDVARTLALDGDAAGRSSYPGVRSGF